MTAFAHPLRKTFIVSTILLCVVTVFDFADRSVLAVLLESIRHEFQLSDAQLGLVTGLSFGITYTILGIPISRWADGGNRRWLMGGALLIWSAMTALCGTAQGLLSLFLLRVGVGAGEAGGVPVCHSLITDYFPSRRHGEAASYLACSQMLGSILGLILGAHIAAVLGWRYAFYIMGIAGICAALLVFALLDEPRIAPRAPKVSEVFSKETMATIYFLLEKRTFVLILLGFASVSLFSLGLQQWGPSFMVRSFHMPLKKVGAVYGGVVNGSLLFGALLGGPITNWLRREGGVKALVRLPAIGCWIAVPAYTAAFLAHDMPLFIVGTVIGGFLLGVVTPPLHACVYGLAGSRRRATAMAIVLLVFNLLGLGLGPLLIGVISDSLRTVVGEESLRYSLLSVMLLLVATGYGFHRCVPRIERDWEGT